MGLTSIPTLVQSPFIIAKIGRYTFGNAAKSTVGNMLKVTFPNYMKSLNIIKVSGEINTYTLQMEYAIEAGDDPNMLDKVFSSVSDTREMTLSYGDWCAPGFIYKEEQVLITNVKSNIDFTSASINYTITGVSKALSLGSAKYSFSGRIGDHDKVKPSELIYSMLSNKSYGLTDIFPGMKDLEKVRAKNLIATDDAAVNIQPMTQINALERVSRLVDCMVPASSSNDTVKTGAVYKLAIYDDNSNDLGGAYFKIVKVGETAISTEEYARNVSTLSHAYEIDIGYPGDNFVTNFSLSDNEQWSILYNSASDATIEERQYRINSDGALESYYSPSFMRSNTVYKTNTSDKTWWTEVTTFPINATITFKGLVRPTMLMNYIKLNVVFYGRRHISSGLYIITKQTDDISASGYSTTLELLRVGGDT